MIREGKYGDCDQISEIYNYFVRESIATFEEQLLGNGEMQRRFKQIKPAYPWLVSEQAGTIEGYAYASQWHSRSAYRYTVETTIYLNPRSIGQGLGFALYGQLLDELQGMDFDSALACVALPNAASIGLHEKLGFKKVGQFNCVGKKFGRWIDVGYWQKSIA